MNKKLIVVPLCAGIAFQFCGCQNASGESVVPDTSETTIVTEATTLETSASEETTVTTLESTVDPLLDSTYVVVFWLCCGSCA